MALTIEDLAAATLYHRSVNEQLRMILEGAKADCGLSSTADNKWNPGGQISRYLALTSPRFGDYQSIRVEFGFDFERDDARWRVAKLRLPSAYFTVLCSDPLELDYPPGWETPLTDWGEEYRHVKHLDSLQVIGESLHIEYLNFFTNARVELWRALGL